MDGNSFDELTRRLVIDVTRRRLLARCAPPATCGGASSPHVCGCPPDCAGKTCGDDGCGGSCGDCPICLTCTGAGTCDPVICPRRDQCHEPFCNLSTGACGGEVVTPGAPCDDGSACSVDTTCQSDGTCGGGHRRVCTVGDPECQFHARCDDFVGDCTVDFRPDFTPCGPDHRNWCGGGTCNACIADGEIAVNNRCEPYVQACCSRLCHEEVLGDHTFAICGDFS
jgi:hypothetical protein